MENNWYILKVVSGQENKISKSIETLSSQGKIFIDEVLVPARTVSKVKKASKPMTIAAARLEAMGSNFFCIFICVLAKLGYIQLWN